MITHLSRGQWVKWQREALNLTQKELAQRVICSLGMIRKIEQDERRPSKVLAARLADVFELTDTERETFFAVMAEERKDDWLPPPVTAVNKQDSTSSVLKPLTSLIGREAEVEHIRELLSTTDVRMVTLTGMGGIGKTRIALEVARTVQGFWRDGVYVVLLGQINDAALVPTMIARKVKIRETVPELMIARLHAQLAERHMLLVLDNFEHVLDASPFVAELLVACPYLTVLATSRERLNLTGEHEYVIPPLALPGTSRLLPFSEIAASDAVKLFVERARITRPHFSLTAQNAVTVATICHRLDGLPLAIELAAARCKMLSPQALLERLDNRLNVLVGGARDLQARQRTLRATIEWSYNALTRREQTLFTRLGVFAGSFTFACVEQVCAGFARSSHTLLDSLQALVDKSLLSVEEGSEPRFRMLQVLREYALEQLEARDERPALSARHAQVFLQRGLEAAPHLRGAGQGEALDRLELEHENVRAAMSWAVGNNEVELAGKLIESLYDLWVIRGYFSEGRFWSERLLPVSGDLPSTHARALFIAADFAYRQGDYQLAEMRWEQSLAIWHDLKDSLNVACALASLAEVKRVLGQHQIARSLVEESIALHRTLNDQYSLASALNVLGAVLRSRHEYALARTVLEESLALYRTLQNPHGEAYLLYRLGTIAYHLADNELERACYEQSLTIRRALGDKWGIAFSLNNLGLFAVGHGDYDHARAQYEESMKIFQELGDREGEAVVLLNLGELARFEGNLDLSVEHLERALPMFRQIGDQPMVADVLRNLGIVVARQGYPGRAFTYLRESLQLQESTNTMNIALCLSALAEAAAADAKFEQAAQLITLVELLRQQLGRELYEPDRIEYLNTVAKIRKHLQREPLELTEAVGQEYSVEHMLIQAITWLEQTQPELHNPYSIRAA